jgi:hypothetical protein
MKYQIKMVDKYGNWSTDPIDGGIGNNVFDDEDEAYRFIDNHLRPGEIWEDIDAADIDVFPIN